MATYVHADVLDGGPNEISSSAIRLLILKAYTFADDYATVLGNAVCTIVISSSDFSQSGADGEARVLTLTAGKTGSVSASSGAAPDTHFAFTDGSSRVLWVVKESANTELFSGNIVTCPALVYNREIVNNVLDFTLLTYPIYFAHAANKSMWPEESNTAFAATVAAGENILDLDSNKLSTGEIVFMHDTTVDRTTSGTGNISSKSLTQWNALTLDPSTWFGGGYPDTEAPPVASNVLSAYKDSSLFSIEIKDGNVASLLSELSSSGIGLNQAVVSSFTSGEMAAINTAGYLSMFLSTAGAESAATVAGYGVDWIGVGTGTSSGQVTAYKGVGLKVAVWTISRRVERDLWLGRGVDGIFSDDSKYSRGTAAMRTTDNFAAQTWDHGMLASDDLLTAGSRGEFFTSDYWGYSSNTTTFRGCLMGYLCPVADPTNFVLDLKITFDSANGGDATRWASVFIGTTDQAYKNDSGTNVGYHILFRKNGSVEIWDKPSGGAGSNLVTTTGTTITDGSEKIFRITVTPTVMKAAQIDGAGADITAASWPTAVSPGAYISLNRAGLACKFRDLGVS